MSDEPELLAGRGADTAATRAGRLSGRILPWLSPAEQLVLWALRRRLALGTPAEEDAVLAKGFRLVFGLAACEPALREFEACFGLLASRPRRDILFCPVVCGCVSVDEELLLLLLVPQPAENDATRAQGRAAASLVPPGSAADLLAACAAFRGRLARAALPRAARIRSERELH